MVTQRDWSNVFTKISWLLSCQIQVHERKKIFQLLDAATRNVISMCILNVEAQCKKKKLILKDHSHTTSQEFAFRIETCYFRKWKEKELFLGISVLTKCIL